MIISSIVIIMMIEGMVSPSILARTRGIFEKSELTITSVMKQEIELKISYSVTNPISCMSICCSDP